MSWLLAVSGRAFRFWLLFGLVVCGVGGLVDDVPGELILRFACVVAATHLLFREWKLYSRWMNGAQTALRAHAERAPPRPELWVFGCMVGGASWVGWALLLSLRDWSQADQALAVVVYGATFWAAISVQWWALALGGFSRGVMAIAVRRIPRAGRPQTAQTLPWMAAVWSLPFLGIGLCGLPSAEGLEVLARTLALRLAVEQATASEETVELLLELGPDDHINEIVPLLNELGATAVPLGAGVSDLDLAQTWVLSSSAQAAVVLLVYLSLDSENVDAIELNMAISASDSPSLGTCQGRGGGIAGVNDPLAGGQAELRRVVSDTMMAALADLPIDSPAVVALIDTGVEVDHEDLRAVVLDRRSEDLRGHGTQIASTIAAASNNRRGVASLNGGGRIIKVAIYPALSSHRSAADDVARAIGQAVSDQVDVINLSFGARGPAPTAVQQAVAHALARGVVVVAAAGNDRGRASDQWPANIPGVIVVSATDGRDQRAAFSNSTSGMDQGLSAPGVGICVATHDGHYALADGTSHAAGMVSGLAGVLKAICPALGPADIYQLLAQTGKPSLGGGPLIQVDAAVLAAARLCPG